MRLHTLAQAEAALGEPAAEWAGRCFEIASALVDRKVAPNGSTAVYGHWLGPVAKGSRFDRGAPFVQHGWVLLPDGRVLDPTRWVFEGAAPYLYVGPADHYDEGGNEWREALSGGAPEFDPNDKVVKITKAAMPETATWNYVERLLDLLSRDDYEPGVVSVRQLSWLANRGPKSLGPHALPVYRAICRLGYSALIPIDNRARVEREHGVELPQ